VRTRVCLKQQSVSENNQQSRNNEDVASRDVDFVPLLKNFEIKPTLLQLVQKYSTGANFLVDGHGCERRPCSRVRLNRNNISFRFFIQAWLHQAIPGAVAAVQKQFENGQIDAQGIEPDCRD
jgi:hypothetical protein